MSHRDRTFAADFRRFFGRGLAILLPSILTLWILWYAFAFVFNNVAVPINRGLRWAAVSAAPYVISESSDKQPAWYAVSDAERAEFLSQSDGKVFRDAGIAATDREIRGQKFRTLWQSHWYLSGAGLVVAIVLIYLAGMLLGGLIGRRVYTRVEGLIARIPGFKQVYPHVKQVVNLIMGEQPMAFKRVVLVQYPRQGIWSVGLVTSASLRAVADQAGAAVLSVFIPSTPTPITGFVINVPESEVVDLPLSVDEAIRFLITGGVLIPDHQKGREIMPSLSRTPAAGSGAQRAV